MKNFELSEEIALKIGGILKKRREELGYSTNFIELHTGINKADLSRIENGKKKKINPFYLKELSKTLKLNQIELFSMAGFIDKEYINSSEMNVEQLKERRYTVESLKNPAELMIISVYSSITAGIDYTSDENPIDFITIPKTSGECIAIKVQGDSMEPTFFNGDIVVLKKDVEVGLGEIGIFMNKISEETLIRRLKKRNEVFVLESDNHFFEDIKIKKDEIYCYGKVINIVKKNLKKKVNPLLEKLELLDPKQQKIIKMMIDVLLEKDNI